MERGTSSSASIDFIAGGGEMGALIRAHDWAAHPLGNPGKWPQSLRTALRLMLNTGHPVYLFWGQPGWCFYNDAYRQLIGPERHPGSLGNPAFDVWEEIWPVIGPQIGQVMRGQGATWHENQLIPITRNGVREDVYWTYSYSPIDEEGAPNGVGGVLVLCTETTVQMRALQERDRLARLFDQAPSFVCLLRGPDHVFDYVNAAHIRLFGSADWLGKPVREAFPDIAGQGFYEILDRVYATGERYVVSGAPVRFARYRGGPLEDRLLDFVYEPVLDEAGKVTGIFCDGYDVTERMQSQTRLRASDEQLRLAVDAAEIGFWDVDPLSGTLFWPPRVKAMFGISPDVPVSMDDFYQGLHPEDRDRVSSAFAGAADPARRELYDVEYRVIGKEDGVIRWVAAKGRGIFDDKQRCVRVIGTAIDISARKLAAEQLLSSQASLAETVATLDALIDHAPIGFAFFDTGHRYIRLNEVVARVNGLPVEAHIGRTASELRPRNAGRVRQLIDDVLRTGEVQDNVEFDGENLSSPGESRAWLTSFFPVFGLRGEVAFVGVTMIDITERRRNEAALREWSEMLEAKVAERTAERDRLWRNSRDLQLVADARGVLREVSPAAFTMLGWVPEDMIGRSALDFVHADDIEAAEQALGKAGREAIPTIQLRLRHRDGGYRWISWVAAPEDNLIYASGRDVTAEREQAAALVSAEAALRQSQKMEAVGQLTGGIAHDFNNLLHGVAGTLDLIRRKPDHPEKVRTWAEAGLKSAERGAKLTAQLLAFSRSQQLELCPLVVSNLVLGMRDLLARTLGPSVHVVMDVGTDGLRVIGDGTQLEMAILNLAINARDAMPAGGDLVVTTRAVTLAGDAELAAGDYVELAVRDTGTGMPAEVIARACDPFFSTKGVGKGTGLGLSQVYGMMRQAGGTVRIESEVGRGTVVCLVMRRTETLPDGEGEPPLIEPQPVQGGATVLVVDDDADVRQVLVSSLEALGYRTLEAEDGYAGIAALDRSGPDVMIVDYAMPGITGAEMARQARLKHPGLPIIFASGYAETAAIEAATGPGTLLLRKPFRINQLAAVLDEILSGRAGEGAAGQRNG